MIASKHEMRRYAGILVVLLVANWLAAPFMFVRHTHIWCEEHQRFEHIHLHHEGDAARAAKTGTHSGAVLTAVDPGECCSDRVHEACTVMAQLKQQSNAFSCHMDCDTVDGTGIVRVAVDCDVRLPLSPLSLAPKNSPPRAG